ncbi:MAG: helix-turn-helix domain-containing protein [Muribaculaceae bacterium]|nr:helix-turn-helix domain-containing protein [Muribaculaceae bacterium]
MATMKVYSFDELKDEALGKIGTPERDAYEAEVSDAVRAYHIGEAIKQARKEKEMTQEQLGALMGVKRAQISRIENGRNLTLQTIIRAFKALGLPLSLQAGNIRVAL